jgi:hypothetical protein
MLITTILIVTAFTTHTARTTPIDNAVVGDPAITCDVQSLTLNFHARNSFTGKVFVKGRYNDGQCRHDYSNSSIGGDQNGNTLTVLFDKCGTLRSRSVLECCDV